MKVEMCVAEVPWHYVLGASLRATEGLFGLLWFDVFRNAPCAEYMPPGRHLLYTYLNIWLFLIVIGYQLHSYALEPGVVALEDETCGILWLETHKPVTWQT